MDVAAAAAALPPPRAFTAVGVVADLDGTLIDSEPAYYASYAAVAREAGKEYSWEVHKHLLGRAEVEGARNMIALLQLHGTTPEQLLHARDAHFVDTMAHLVPLEGALELAQSISARGLPAAIATSSSRKYLALKRAANEPLFSCFHHFVCGDDAAVGGHSKPHPAIFIAGAEAIGVPAHQCVAFEDSIAGVASAKAAGMFVVAIPDKRLNMHDLVAAAPDVILPSLRDFNWTCVGL